MFQRRVNPDATAVLEAVDLKEPNEFDQKLLESEGRDYAGVRVRGGRVVARATSRDRAEGSRPPDRSGVRALPTSQRAETARGDAWREERQHAGAFVALSDHEAATRTSGDQGRMDTGRLRAARARGRALLESDGALPIAPPPLPTPVYWTIVSLGVIAVAALVFAVAVAAGMVG